MGYLIMSFMRDSGSFFNNNNIQVVLEREGPDS